MYWKLFVSLLPHLLVCSSLARSVIYENVEDDVAAVGSLIREVRQPVPLKIASELKDLMSAGNAPEPQDTKKRMKNSSDRQVLNFVNALDVLLSVTRADNNVVLGKSDEGGYYRTYGSDAEGEKGYLKETYGKGDHGYKSLDTFHKQDGDKYEFETQISYGKADDNRKKDHNEKESHDHEGAGTMIDTDYAADASDNDEGNEYSHYTGNVDGDHYSNHYTEKEEPESYSHSEKYSSGDGDDDSHEIHSSYSSDGEEDEGDHY